MNASPDHPAEPEINPEGFRSDPGGHVYGIVDLPKRDIPAVVADLLAADIPLDGVHVYCCNEGVDQLDPDGTRHGLRARITRMVQKVGYSNDHLETIETELAAGHALIGVAVDDDRENEIANLLRRHGGHDIVHYGKYTWHRHSQRTEDSPPDP